MSITAHPVGVAATSEVLSEASDTSDLSVLLEDVSVCYRMPSEKTSSIKDHVVRQLTGRKVTYTEFWALRRINLQVRRGEAIGLVGRNGAGKSTLLKVIARVVQPTSGRVWARGAIAPLIELGAGFHPELTGRENIFANGAMLGLSRKHMQTKFDSIVEFAGLHTFIDSPLRTYSSSMQARLAFAIIADADPDVLIVDEALSVGDEAFRKKCVERMHAFRAQGVTIFYVSHGMESISSLCPYSLWLDGGRIRYGGPTDEVIDLCRQSMDSEVSLSETQKMQIVREGRGPRGQHQDRLSLRS